MAAVSGPKLGPVQWNGVFSCTAHIEGRLPAITMKDVPFRQEGDRVTGLYNFTDSFKHRNSVTFSGTMNGQSARIAVTAIRADGSPNFTAEYERQCGFDGRPDDVRRIATARAALHACFDPGLRGAMPFLPAPKCGAPKCISHRGQS